MAPSHSNVAKGSRNGLPSFAERGRLPQVYTPSFVFFAVLGGAKLRVGEAIKSPALRKDGLCSLAGSVMSLAILASAARAGIELRRNFDDVFRNAPAPRPRRETFPRRSALVEKLTPVWWVDCAVALAVALGLGAVGARTLARAARAGVEWWTCSFWTGARIAASDGTPAQEEDASLLGGEAQL